MAASNAREVVALRQKVEVQQQAMAEKDKNVEEIKTAAAKNEADLRDALHKTEVELASKTGQLIATEANVTRLTAIVDILVKSTRKKSIGLIAF